MVDGPEETHKRRLERETFVELGGFVQYNVRPMDQVYRVGGDEFAVLLPGLISEREILTEVKDRIRAAVNEALVAELPADCEVGIGIDTKIEHDTPVSLYSPVDRQMYADKFEAKAEKKAEKRER